MNGGCKRNPTLEKIMPNRNFLGYIKVNVSYLFTYSKQNYLDRKRYNNKIERAVVVAQLAKVVTSDTRGAWF